MKSIITTVCLALLSTMCMAAPTDSISVTFKGQKAVVKCTDAAVKVKVDKGRVELKDSKENRPLKVRVAGKSSDGYLHLATGNDLTLTLDGVSLTSTEGAPLVMGGKGRATVIAAKGKENTLAITACVDTAKHKAAAVWTKKDLTLAGKGTLSVVATGDGCKGIVVKNNLTVNDLTLNVTTSGMYLSADSASHFGPGGGMPPFGPGGFDMDSMTEDQKAEMERMRKHFEEMMQNGEFPPFPGGRPEGTPDDDAHRHRPFGGHPFGGGMPPFGRAEGDSIGMPPFGGGPGFGGFGGFGSPDGGFGGGMPPFMGEYIGTTKAIKATGVLTINSGNVTVKTSTPGAEGIEGKKGVVVNGGTVWVKAHDDAINANATMSFNGGKVTAWSTNNDAIDANIEGGFSFGMMFGGSQSDSGKDIDPGFKLSGGEVYAFSQTGPPEEGFDCDFAPFIVSGGTAFSIGAGMGDMPSVPSADTAHQPTMLVVGVDFAEGDKVVMTDSNGVALIQLDAPFAFNHSSTMITSPLLHVGEVYTLRVGEKEWKCTQSEAFTVVRL